MRAASTTPRDLATKIAGRFPPAGKETSPTLFGDVARVIWPTKTAFELAAIAGTSDRAAKDWLSGKVPPPACVVAEMFVRVTKRE
jgi:hypothetical protein